MEASIKHLIIMFTWTSKWIYSKQVFHSLSVWGNVPLIVGIVWHILRSWKLFQRNKQTKKKSCFLFLQKCNTTGYVQIANRYDFKNEVWKCTHWHYARCSTGCVSSMSDKQGIKPKTWELGHQFPVCRSRRVHKRKRKQSYSGTVLHCVIDLPCEFALFFRTDVRTQGLNSQKAKQCACVCVCAVTTRTIYKVHSSNGHSSLKLLSWKDTKLLH